MCEMFMYRKMVSISILDGMLDKQRSLLENGTGIIMSVHKEKEYENRNRK